MLDKLTTLRQPAPHPPAGELGLRERESLKHICEDFDDEAITEHLEIS
ncbi:hypothetical protein ACFSC3_08340 [Sphingomonas floccifaciens]|uniref:Uncharacterized protein n=1 Tax=Sphingomonas floccifaciens TaxID=1844115 RepID=A0ABW4NBQ1_9SPHN